MRPVRSTWRAILSSLALAVLLMASASLVATVAGYFMAPPRAEPDPAIFVIIAGLTLGPSIMLGIAVRRARIVSAHWDFGRVGIHILMFGSLLVAAVLGVCGLYALVCFMGLVVAH